MVALLQAAPNASVRAGVPWRKNRVTLPWVAVNGLEVVAIKELLT